MDNENVRKKKEEEEKIAKQHQEVRFKPLILLKNVSVKCQRRRVPSK